MSLIKLFFKFWPGLYRALSFQPGLWRALVGFDFWLQPVFSNSISLTWIVSTECTHFSWKFAADKAQVKSTKANKIAATTTTSTATVATATSTATAATKASATTKLKEISPRKESL